MSFNVAGSVEVPLEVFGSWITEMASIDTPKGASPDNQDVSYLPGSVGSRPAFEKYLATAFPAGGTSGLVPTVVYGKSFVTPTGDIKNLYMDSNGILWVEDVSNSPGAYTQLYATTPGSFARSVTAFGREYIAISDGLHGADQPLQYDGTYLDRVTMDGPAAAPTITSVALASSQMVASGNTLTRSNNIVTCETATDHNMEVGYLAQISNVPDSNATTVNQDNNSGSQVVNSSVWDLNGSQYRSLFNPGTSGLAALVAENFGFSIPANATILGIIASFSVLAQGATTSTVNEVALWYSGAQEGTAKTPGTPITTSAVTTAYGSAADLWGAALTPAIVNSPTFGFAISITADSERIFIDFPFTITVYYTLSGSGTVAEIVSITIDNETNPGQALVTTSSPHGLVPEINVSIVGVEPATVASVSAAQWSSGTTTLTTQTNHDLNPGSTIQVNGVTTTTSGTVFSFNGTFVIESVPSPNQLTYLQVPINSSDPDVINATADTGSLTIAWPIPQNTPTPTYFEVQSCPTSTTFYIPISYSDATWTSGTVGFIWEGTFYVTAVLSPTEFQYQQYGPNGATTAVGTVTPYGQAAPGLHQLQVMWLTRQGAISRPSPPVKFIANGGQYLQVTNIAVGPDNVVGRILAFTGADGDLFFYIPNPAQVTGQVVSTATQINDNSTTNILLDFSDNTLFAAIGINVPGNNLPDQIVIDGALGFGYYDGRLTTWGQRNIIQNFLNMGFEGGYLPSTPTQPTGWSGSGGALSSGHNGTVWGVTGASGITTVGTLTQSAYEDAYGAPILTGNTQYSLRVWLQGSGGVSGATLTVAISSASTAFSTSVEFTSFSTYAAGAYQELEFGAKTPDTIPTDMIITVTLSVPGVGTVLVDELQPIYTSTPYQDTVGYASYEENPEGFDGDTGKYGAQNDTRKLMEQAVIRDTLYLITQDPSGRVHETNGSDLTEPSGWEVSEVAANCGVLSAFSVTKSQADDGSASGGEEWLAWASESGARIFSGSEPWKISQEIQSAWNDPQNPTWPQVNMAAALTCWTLNDPVERVIYFGVPTGTATAPNLIYPVSYRQLDTAESIAQAAPYRTSLSGNLVVTDNTRKWTRWNATMNGAARMYAGSTDQLSTVFFGGNGNTYGASAGHGNIYTLNPDLYTDSDFGQINSYYTTYFFVGHQEEQQLQLGSHRKMLAYLMAYIEGVGQITITPLVNNLQNPWPLVCVRTLALDPNFDLEWAGGSCTGQRMALKIQPSPVSGGTDNAFFLQKLIAVMRQAARLPVRGAAQ